MATGVCLFAAGAAEGNTATTGCIHLYVPDSARHNAHRVTKQLFSPDDQLLQRLWEPLQHNHLFVLAFILLSGYLLGRLARRVGLPEITGFILAGLFAGPHLGGVVQERIAADLQLLAEIALAIIAFTVGSNVLRSTLARAGRAVAFLATGHVVGGLVFVTLFLTLAGLPFSAALVMGVLAGGSSPGTVVAVVQSVRARGPFVEHLFGVVAVATAITITAFGAVLSFLPVFAQVEGAPPITLPAALTAAIGDVVLSVIVGVIGGTALHLVTRRRTDRGRTVIVTFGILLVTTSLALAYEFSTLLSNMALGIVYINLSRIPHTVMETIRSWSPPLYAVFFVLAGAKLDPAVLADTVVLFYGLVYVAARIAGSYAGTSAATRVCASTPEIRRYMPLCLVPQAGVVLGLVLVLVDAPILETLPPPLSAALAQTVTITLLAVLIKEIVGPPISAFALKRGATTADS